MKLTALANFVPIIKFQLSHRSIIGLHEGIYGRSVQKASCPAEEIQGMFARLFMAGQNINQWANVLHIQVVYGETTNIQNL